MAMNGETIVSERTSSRVAIIGSGPAGLALAIELGSRGVPCVVLERSARAGHAPRAKTTNVRTREHLRRWGIAGDLAAASPLGVDYPSDVLFVTSLAGKLIHRFENALNCRPDRDDRYAEHAQWIPQYKLEGVLAAHAESLPGVTIDYGQEFLGFTQDDDGVTLRILDHATGTERTLAVDYLVGADGARSVVRDAIGAQMVGRYGLSRNYNTIFSAPGLAAAHGHGPGIMYWQLNSDAPSLIGPMDTPDLWYFMPTGVPDGVTYPDDTVLALIRQSTGIDLPYRILSSDVWVASRLLADRYSQGRVFLIGDACHLHPPFGGFGMNMGVADGVDLGWKLAAVLHGWGGAALLASYEGERRFVHDYVMDEAEANHALIPSTLLRPGLADDTPAGAAARAEAGTFIRQHKAAEFYALGVILGYCYATSPIVVDDGTMADWTRSRDYVPQAIPGCLAPHAWLADGSSLYDHFGADFTLLTFGGASSADAVAEAHAAGVPLTVVALAAELQTLYQAPLALVRPDQHVAWRGTEWQAGVFDRVTGRKDVQVSSRAAALAH